MNEPNATTKFLPCKPRLVLRVGFAGNCQLPEDTGPLDAALDTVLSAIGRRLAGIAPAADGTRIGTFYNTEVPLLRLVTGLAEGADAHATAALERCATVDISGRLDSELAAVLPFDLLSYRETRPAGFRAEFDSQAARCAYILALDGHYERPEPDTPSAAKLRANAYRAQSELLLRHADVLLAVANPNDQGKAGGTMETVRNALALNIAVIFIDADSGEIRLIESFQEFGSTLAAPAPDDCRPALSVWIDSIVAGPDIGFEPGSGIDAYEEKMPQEYFHAVNLPPRHTDKKGPARRRLSLRECCWTSFVKCFRSDKPDDGPKTTDAPPNPYNTWRSRATKLNYHYAGLYRGAFLLNYGLAVMAVLLAALSLVLMALGYGALWLLPLGALKLLIVVWIMRNTHSANSGDWNDKAVDYRYLAERLRAMSYLPGIGSFRPPVGAAQPFSSRVVRQSAVDWMAEAIIRGVSPETYAVASEFPGQNGDHFTARIMRINPAKLLERVRADWIKGQADYHKRTSAVMGRMFKFTERAGAALSQAVIFFVVVDVLILVSEQLPFFPEQGLHWMHEGSLWLVFLAALLPAAVAGLNGIRFQSECRRLAERSATMHAILQGHDGQGGRLAAAERLAARINAADADPASRTLDVLRYTETVAADFAQEVAEWSVLYAKELPDPG